MLKLLGDIINTIITGTVCIWVIIETVCICKRIIDYIRGRK